LSGVIEFLPLNAAQRLRRFYDVAIFCSIATGSFDHNQASGRSDPHPHAAWAGRLLPASGPFPTAGWKAETLGPNVGACGCAWAALRFWLRGNWQRISHAARAAC